jgi:hypothetical protein
MTEMGHRICGYAGYIDLLDRQQQHASGDQGNA